LTAKAKIVIKSIFGLVDLATYGMIKRNTIVGLVYHEISNNPCQYSIDTRTFTSIPIFSKQMGWILGFFRVIDARSIDPVGMSRKLVLSFDDGYRSFKCNALPLITRLEFPVICFVNSVTVKGGINSSALVAYKSSLRSQVINWVDSNSVFYGEQLRMLSESEKEDLKSYQGEYLSWGEIDEIMTNPLVCFGNHLSNHWYPPSLTESEFRESLRLNASEFAEVGVLERILSWPHGVSTNFLSNLAQDEGIKLQFFGMSSTNIETGTLLINRVDMNELVSNYLIFRGTLLLARLGIL
jgi:peptidoglycan/xylan/chitin deacetylase (PgdA/CDA1 family)